jgi:Domain of unknown function (DUF4340)
MKRSNWVLLTILALSIGGYFLLKYQSEKKAASEPTSTPSTSYLAQESGSALQSIRISDKDNHIVELKRGEDNLWTVTLPTPGAADQSLAGEAETQLGALGVVSDLGTVTNLGDFGLDTPAYTIVLAFTNGVQHTLEVGNLTPTSSGYYVQQDNGTVYVVSQYSLDSVLNLIQNPPYPPTPTPEPANVTPEAATPTP